MSAVTFIPFENAILDLFKGKHNFETHTFKLYLTNTAPNVATMANKADLPEISAGNGYVAGGYELTIDSVSQTGGNGAVAATPPGQMTAAGGNVAAFRYIVLYNDTDASDALVSYWDYGAEVNMKDGEKFNFALEGANILTGLLQAAA